MTNKGFNYTILHVDIYMYIRYIRACFAFIFGLFIIYDILHLTALLLAFS